MFLLTYPGGLRLIVHTANLIYADCNDKTQGVWVQDFPPKQPHGPGGAAGAPASSPSSPFARDLSAYITALRLPAAQSAAVQDAIAQHDFTYARRVGAPPAALSQGGHVVASAPGYHTGPALHANGHMRLRALLQREALPAEPGGAGGAGGAGLVVQVSSMGSFSEEWLLRELGASLAAHRGPALAGAAGARPAPSGPPGSGGLPLHIVWPTVEEVRNSIEGWHAGSSIPGPVKNVGKPFMPPYYCRWEARGTGRQRAMPHIKTYTRFCGQRLAWFLLASHNLSKAAWGELQKKGTQLMVRSYELGVLLTPGLEAAYLASPQCGFSCTGAAGGQAPGSRLPRQLDPGPVQLEFVTREAWLAQRLGGGPGAGGGGAVALRVPLPVPYALPPVRYQQGPQADRPWAVDDPQPPELLDAAGRSWGERVSHYGYLEQPEGA